MTLHFGTAGVRAQLGAGPEQLNAGTVGAIAAGIASWLAPGASAVVGHDARHGSADFASSVATALRGRGVRDVSAGLVPTPVLAFVTRHGDYSAGVMVTASHNPASDNGIKVYDATGAQLGVEQAAAVEAAIATPRPADALTTLEHRALDAVAPYLAALPDVTAGVLDIAYTPLHGVGGSVFVQALRRSGFRAPSVVTEQAAPDPDFPTAPFPNPEEPGVLDLLRGLVRSTRADVGIAHDPDADRLAVLVGDRALTGDELGLLLADEVLRRRPGPVATTVVSAGALRALARRRGVPYEETLTGFKHLVRAHGGDLTFCYEEALGYCVAPSSVRDKDGISAGLLVCAMAAADRAVGRTLLDRLSGLEHELGLEVATAQVSLRTDDPAQLLVDARSSVPQGFSTTREDPFTIANGIARVVVRPSGTEPKLKAYLQTRTRAQLPALRRTVTRWLIRSP